MMDNNSKSGWSAIRLVGDPETLGLLSQTIDIPGIAGIVLDEKALQLFVAPGADAAQVLLETQSFVDELIHEGLVDPQSLIMEPAEPVVEVDWVGRWRASLGAVRAGRQFVVVPPDIPFEEKEGDLVLRLEPRMAFGTGEHATTRMALALLEDVAQSSESVLDLGCGNGVLAIGALLAGAKRATGIDNEPESIQETLENAETHGFSDKITVVSGDVIGFEPSEKVDLLLANIFLNPILKGIDLWLPALLPGGHAIFTGVREEEEGPKLLSECAARGLELEQTMTEAGWMAARFRKA